MRFGAEVRRKLIFGFRFICEDKNGNGRVAQPRRMFQNSIENWKLVLSTLDQQVQNFTSCFLPRAGIFEVDQQALRISVFWQSLQGALSVSNERGGSLLTMGCVGYKYGCGSGFPDTGMMRNCQMAIREERISPAESRALLASYKSQLDGYTYIG